MDIQIGTRSIGPDKPPLVIAEVSANHNGDLGAARRLVVEAARAGAQCVKFQTYTADTITLDADSEDFIIRGGLWDGRRLHDLYAQASMPWEWHAELFTLAREHGMLAFSTPFDASAVDFLEGLDVPAYKIASFEAIDLPLIRYVASTGKPMIISTGLADADEIQEAIDAARAGGCRQLAILHCVSGYPAPAADYNLRTIPDMIERYGVVTGLSDHTLDNTTAIAAVALGASIIEKHFTLDRSGGGPDDSFSLEPADLAALCRGARTAWEALGRVDYSRKPSEAANLKFRRSLYFVKDLAAGERVTAECIRSVRPGYGAPPKAWDDVIGKRVRIAVGRNTPVRLDDLQD
jgi:pseudaminic acid synthase